MSETQILHSQLLIGSLIQSPELSQALEKSLDTHSYRIHPAASGDAFLQWVGENRHRVDCLLMEPTATLSDLLKNLQLRDILLPALILQVADSSSSDISYPDEYSKGKRVYHQAILALPDTELLQTELYIHQAINQFLQLPCNQPPISEAGSSLEDTRGFLLSLQQQRLSEKLKERLGYLGIYYKRSPDGFIRNLPAQERAQILKTLRTDYRKIILGYFANDGALNRKIDDFVNTAFFADVSVSQIVELHMELMESFSKQLKLEGRSEEILLDYRLTLIDVIAHLCEMYRRSIPRDL